MSVVQTRRFALALCLATGVLALLFVYRLTDSASSIGGSDEPRGNSAASTEGPDPAAEAYGVSDRRQPALGQGNESPAYRTPGADLYVVRGRLTDSDATPLAGAQLALTCRPTLLTRLGVTELGEAAVAVTSDAEGLFELSYDPWAQPFASGEDVELVVTRDRHASLSLSISLGLEVLDLGTLKLPASIPWTGRVLEADGTPIRVSAVEAWNQTGLRARVWPSRLASAPGGEIPRAETRTNAEGHFLMHGLDNGIRALLIGTEDIQFYVPIESAATTLALIQAPVLMTAMGQILDPDGGPLADAAVFSLQETPQGWIRIGPPRVSGSAGNFEIPLRWQHGVALGVHTPGFQPKILELGEESLAAPLVVQLEPGRKRVVQVVDAESGAPVKDAELILFVESSILIDGHELPVSALNVEGLRSLRAVDARNGGQVVGLGGGRFNVLLDRPYPWILAATAEGFVRELIEESPDEDQEQVIRIALSRGNLVRGRVLDETTGKPCAGAVVRILHPNNIGAPLVAGASGNLVAVTDQQGRYRIAGIPTGTFRATASSPGFTTVASGPILFEETGAETKVDLGLARNSVVHGEVQSLDPALTPPYSVYVTSEEPAPPGSALEGSIRRTLMRRSRVLTTDPNGRFEVADLSPGHWRFDVHRALEAAVWKSPSEGRNSSITALMPGESALNVGGAPPLSQKIVSLQPGEARDVVLSVGRSEGDSVGLQGYLVYLTPDSDLRYIARYSSYTPAGAYDDQVSVDEYGVFDFGLVPPGKGTIHVLCRSESASNIDHFLAATQVELEAGVDQVVPIALPGVALVWFDTHEAETNTAISTAAVQFASLDLQGFGGAEYKQTGLARLLPVGHYIAVATALGYVTQFVTFEVKPYEQSSIVPFPLTRIERQLTSFQDAGGSPLAGHRVQIREIDGVSIPISLMPTFTTDDTGTVQMGVMPPSLYFLAVFDRSGELVYEGEVDFRRPQSEVFLEKR